MKLIISLLGADIYKDAAGLWHTTDLNMRDTPEREPADSFRVIAASYLAKRGALIYAQGGLADDTYPPIADVMEYELRELGIPKAQIATEVHSKTTATQLIQLQDFLRRKMPKTIMILTNEWHLPRVKAMIAYLPEFTTLRSMKPIFVSAEEVLLQSDPTTWQQKIVAARKRPEMKEIIGLEKKGVHQIENGTYTRE